MSAVLTEQVMMAQAMRAASFVCMAGHIGSSFAGSQVASTAVCHERLSKDWPRIPDSASASSPAFTLPFSSWATAKLIIGRGSKPQPCSATGQVVLLLTHVSRAVSRSAPLGPEMVGRLASQALCCICWSAWKLLVIRAYSIMHHSAGVLKCQNTLCNSKKWTCKTQY